MARRSSSGPLGQAPALQDHLQAEVVPTRKALQLQGGERSVPDVVIFQMVSGRTSMSGCLDDRRTLACYTLSCEKPVGPAGYPVSASKSHVRDSVCARCQAAE